MKLDASMVAVVTGGAGGIGAATIDALRARGLTVIGTDLEGRGADVVLDVTDRAAVPDTINAIAERHGRLDLVVHTAGIGAGGLVEDLDEDAWRRTIDVNVWGTVNVLRAAYPHMIRQRRGHLALIASLSGLVPTPLLVPYALSKSATVGLATSLAPEAHRHGVGVSAICPGPVDTPLLDSGGIGGVVRGVDTRRYLTAAAGKAISAERVAATTLRAVEHGRVIVAPGTAGLLWRVTRLSPSLAAKAVALQMRRELARAS